MLWTFVYGLSVVNILKILKHHSKKLFSIIILVLFIFLPLILSEEILHIKSYKHSFYHNPSNEGGLEELIEFSNEYNIPEGSNIFSPNQLEVPYYLDRPIIWDYRIFFVSKKEVLQYFPYYNSIYLIIPNYMLQNYIYSSVYKEYVPNTKDNWIGGSLPMDSDFYKLLKEEKYFKLVKKYNTFTVYKYEGDTNE
ncbi:MAG TPA: hypothetical protein ENI51_04485 [Candidatus Atribacteria bacterium]|nr:hypothetical protein [Candidatus Atribacteria bacterium]